MLSDVEKGNILMFTRLSPVATLNTVRQGFLGIVASCNCRQFDRD